MHKNNLQGTAIAIVIKRIGGCHSSLKNCLRSRHFIFSFKGAVFSFPGGGENNNFISHHTEFFPGPLTNG